MTQNTIWATFSTELGDVWARHGFRRNVARRKMVVHNHLEETSQLVEYRLGAAAPDQIAFTIELAVWSHRLAGSGTHVGPRSNVRNGHWWENIANLIPPDLGHLWWPVTAGNLDADLSLHRDLAERTILPILDNLRNDAGLVRAWQEGGPMSGLSPLTDRAANAVLLAQAVGGHNLAAAVASNMRTITDRAFANRPEEVARLRRLLDALPDEVEFFEATTDTEAN